MRLERIGTSSAWIGSLLLSVGAIAWVRFTIGSAAGPSGPTGLPTVVSVLFLTGGVLSATAWLSAILDCRDRDRECDSSAFLPWLIYFPIPMGWWYWVRPRTDRTP